MLVLDQPTCLRLQITEKIDIDASVICWRNGPACHLPSLAGTECATDLLGDESAVCTRWSLSAVTSSATASSL